MPLYNKAMYHFGKITRNQSDGTYVQSVERKKEPSIAKHSEEMLTALAA